MSVCVISWPEKKVVAVTSKTIAPPEKITFDRWGSGGSSRSNYLKESTSHAHMEVAEWLQARCTNQSFDEIYWSNLRGLDPTTMSQWSDLPNVSDISDQFIEVLANDPSYSRRGDAAKALGLLGDIRAIDPLTKASSDDDSWVRRAAKESLHYLRRRDEKLRRAAGMPLKREKKSSWSCFRTVCIAMVLPAAGILVYLYRRQQEAPGED